jgi:FkbH-like protein
LIPDIIVPELPEDPALYVRAISELNLFETAAHSAADAGRTAMYQEQQKREAESNNHSTLEDYLKSLETKASVQRFTSAALPRIAQLIQRSNQFNLTTRRYSEAECQAMMEDRERCFPFTISVQDRFGDFGLINVVAVRLRRSESVLEIDTFLMSCRVLQRGVEQLAMNRIFEFAEKEGFKEVSGRYIPTTKNVMVKSFYEQFGFHQTATDADGTTHWRAATSEYQPRRVFIEVSGG